MSTRYYARRSNNQALLERSQAVGLLKSEVQRKEQWLTAMLECLLEVAVDIPCYGDSFPEQEWCSACRARHLGRHPFTGVDKCRSALANRVDPPSPKRGREHSN